MRWKADLYTTKSLGHSCAHTVLCTFLGIELACSASCACTKSSIETIETSLMCPGQPSEWLPNDHSRPQWRKICRQTDCKHSIVFCRKNFVFNALHDDVNWETAVSWKKSDCKIGLLPNPLLRPSPTPIQENPSSTLWQNSP